MRACLRLSGYIVGGLVDDVHQNGGQVGHHEDTQKVSWGKHHLNSSEGKIFTSLAVLLTRLRGK